MFKTINEFPNYEINKNGIVRRKGDGFEPNIRENGYLSLKGENGFRSLSLKRLLTQGFFTPKDIESLKNLGYSDYGITYDGKIWSHNKCKWLCYRRIGRGYLGCSLVNNYGEKHFLVHRILALLFIPNLKNKPTVNHIDGNKLNNCVLNLEWATYKENNNHAIINDLRTSILNISEVHRICRYLSNYNTLTTQKISQVFNISWGIIGDIRNRKTWVNISKSYTW